VIAIPLVGDVRAAGLTARELEEEISRRIVAADLLRTPQVSVQIAEYRSRVVAVVGSVERPGSYPLTRSDATVGDLIWAAGGPTRDAGRIVEFVPANDAQPMPVAAAAPEHVATAPRSDGPAIRLDLDYLLRARTEGRSVGPPVRPGDVISVSPAGSVLIDGWVAKPGSYPVTRGLTLSGAVAAAGGSLFAADRGNVTVQRVRGTADRQLFTADLDAISRGDASDPPISDGDVIRLSADTARVVPWGAWVATRELLHVGGSVPLF
jgi:polysaccharide biosynthesis/export protein